MSASIFHRRRAERFAQLIDEADGGRRRHTRSAVDDDLAGFIALSRRVSDLPVRVETHQEFRDGLRTMLLATIEREGIGTTAREPEPETAPRRSTHTAPAARRNRARIAIIGGLAAGTLAVSGMSAASGDAIPGDPLYSVKRSTERAQLALAGSDISRGQLYLEFARTRLDEAQAVRGDAGGLVAVLNDMDSETRQGVRLLNTTAAERRDPAALDAIDSFAADQLRAAARLRDGLAGEARARADLSVRLLDETVKRSKALRAVLRCSTVATGTDALGPLPRLNCKPGAGQRPNAPANSENLPAGNGITSSDQTTAPAGAPPASSAPVESGSPTPPAPGTQGGSPSSGLLDGVRGLVGGTNP
jgi:hypothetical protein